MENKPEFQELDDLLMFAEEDIEKDERIDKTQKPWKILIVDDEESVHQVTHLLLDHFEYENAGLEMLSAYSAEEARVLLNENPDIAVVLLDVVMGNDESGLHLVKFIRDELKNHMIRIILRTGQPGQAPEKTVIVEYDINDYKLKTELTADKIYVTMVAALRTYHDMLMLENHKKTLGRTINAIGQMISKRKIPEFVKDVGVQFSNVLNEEDKYRTNIISSMTLIRNNNDFIVYSSLGDFEGREGQKVSDFLANDSVDLIKKAYKESNFMYDRHQFVVYLMNEKGLETLFYVSLQRNIDDWDKKIIEIFSATVNTAYMNLTLSQDVETTQRELIYALGEVAEARSKETGCHVKRVSEYARLFATILNMSPIDIELLAMASPVHDIGKLSIPDAILNKPGKLTNEEFEIIKTHAQAGYDMLKGSNQNILQMAALIAYQHHEKWDGTGYPLGLKEEEIHIFGRIIALCDVFDALGSDRIYKKAWPMEEIKNYMQQERGKQFDPLLVDIFFENFDLFISIRDSIL